MLRPRRLRQQPCDQVPDHMQLYFADFRRFFTIFRSISTIALRHRIAPSRD